MADVKISQLPAASTPLAGTEQIPLVQDAVTKQITVSNLLTSANLGTPSAVNLANATNVPMAQASGTLAVNRGGTGTTTPALVAGTNVTISGSWPNQTINSTYSGAVTSVTGTAPVVSSGGTTPAISMPAATGSVSGYLTSTDWTTFNSKQPAGSYLTSGGALGTPSSGTATNLTGLPLSTGVTGLLPVANGGTGTATPALVAGSNVTISGTWPNQTIAAAGAAQVYPDAGIANSTGSAWGTSYTTTGSGTVLALATSPTFVTPVLGTPTSGNFSTGTFTWPTFNQNTTGTAANITATSNSTITTLSSLSLPGSQVSGNIAGNAANVTGTVAVANGGTGLTTTPANGALDIGNGTGFTRTTLTAGSNITITNSAGGITIAATGGGGSGTVTSVSGTGTVNGLTLTGTVTTSGSLTLGGTLDLSSPPAIGSTAANTGAFTTLAASSTVTLSGGTANGVTYLNGSKVVTSGSALTFDGNKLQINSSAASYNPVLIQDTATSYAFTNNFLAFYNSTSAMGGIGHLAANDLSVYALGNLAFGVNNAEAMRLTSTGLGIGTSSPSYKLQVSGTSNTVGLGITGTSASGDNGIYYNVPAITGSYNAINAVPSASTGVNVNFGNGNSTSANANTRLDLLTTGASGGDPKTTYTISGVLNWCVGVDNSDSDKFKISGSDSPGTSDYLTIDTSGNLGVGTTSPSQRLDVQAAKAKVFATSTTGTNDCYFAANNTGGAFYIGIDNSTGTEFGTAYAGAIYRTGAYPITFYTNSTERARIDSSGNVLVGTTGTDPQIGGSGTKGIALRGPIGFFAIARSGDTPMAINRTTSTGDLIEFRYNGAGAVGTISYNGTVTVYNTTSDYRLKTVIGAVTGHGERIDALEPIEYTWNSNGSRTRGFLAHKFQEVYADSVTGEKDAVDADGNPKYQAMQASTSEVIADLVAEIQSLRKRLANAGIA